VTDWQVMIRAMEADPTNAELMCVAADALEESGDPVGAECLRWMGEHGLTGEPPVAEFCTGYGTYSEWESIIRNCELIGPYVIGRRGYVFKEWHFRSDLTWISVITQRLKLVDAYRKATHDERKRWLTQTEIGLKIYDRIAELTANTA